MLGIFFKHIYLNFLRLHLHPNLPKIQRNNIFRKAEKLALLLLIWMSRWNWKHCQLNWPPEWLQCRQVKKEVGAEYSESNFRLFFQSFTFKERQNVGLHLSFLAKFQACYCHLATYFFAPFVTNHWCNAWEVKLYRFMQWWTEAVWTAIWFRWTNSCPKTSFGFQISNKSKRLKAGTRTSQLVRLRSYLRASQCLHLVIHIHMW